MLVAGAIVTTGWEYLASDEVGMRIQSAATKIVGRWLTLRELMYVVDCVL